jgi:hypothetical protein
VVSLGGFDTHADQVVENETTTGVHAELLRELSEAIYAFQDDLKAMDLEHRVAGMTYSEFGRRIRSNFSNGTDHGTAAPLIVFGSCVLPGIIGDNPEISVDIDDQEGLPMQYDFRSVYGSILTDWFKVEENIVSDILLGDFQKINLLQDCASPVGTEDIDVSNIELHVYPNPASQKINIDFVSNGEDIKISIFDALGQEVDVITNRRFTSGLHSMTYESHRLTSGVYFIRIQTKSGQKTKRVVKA